MPRLTCFQAYPLVFWTTSINAAVIRMMMPAVSSVRLLMLIVLRRQAV
jgi:hypothetical protein